MTTAHTLIVTALCIGYGSTLGMGVVALRRSATLREREFAQWLIAWTAPPTVVLTALVAVWTATIPGWWSRWWLVVGIAIAVPMVVAVILARLLDWEDNRGGTP